MPLNQVPGGGDGDDDTGPAAWAESPPLVKFRASTVTDDDTRLALAHFLGTMQREWRDGRGVAVLSEANTTFGLGLRESLSRVVVKEQLRFDPSDPSPERVFEPEVSLTRRTRASRTPPPRRRG